MTTPADPASDRISDLPEGVNLASSLAEDDARQHRRTGRTRPVQRLDLVCGNTADTAPFRPCDAAGHPADAAGPPSWLCPACGRIIDPTGVVVGRTPTGTAVNPVAGGRPDTWPGVRHSTAGIGQAWLHLPTGAAGLIGVRPHHDLGPIADRCTRLLKPATPSPLPVGHPCAGRTAVDVDAALHEWGWQVITRAEAADRLRAAGYVLGTNRRAGHLLYADDADEITWRPDATGYGMEAFAAPIEPPAAPRAR